MQRSDEVFQKRIFLRVTPVTSRFLQIEHTNKIEMNKFNLLLISLFIIQICSTTRSPTYNNRYPTPYPTRRPTPYPTPRPTQAFNNIYASYNLSKLDEEDYQTNLQSVTFKEAMTDRISDAITTVIQPSPTPTSWYYPDIEELYFSEADKTLDMYINIEGIILICRFSADFNNYIIS